MRGRAIPLTKAPIMAAALWLAAAAGAAAQLATTPFSGFKHDASQPIEVSSESLEVRNSENRAIFVGDVDVKQGVVRLTSQRLEVTYKRGGAGGGGGVAGAPGAGAIDRLIARGDVFMTNGKENAKAETVDYDVEAGTILLTGDVVLEQSGNAIKAQALTIDLATGKATLGSGGAVASDGGASSGGRVRVRLGPTE